MKKTINFKLFVAVALGLIALFSSFSLTSAQNLGGDSTINTLDQWKATSTPISAITQRTFGKPLVLTGYSAGCAQFTATGTLQSTGTNCGAGGGTSTPSIGSGGWVQFASTTTGYFDAIAGFIFNKSTGALSIDGTMSANIYVATSTTATSSLPNISASSTLITSNALGGNQNDSRGLILQNTTAAANTVQQISPGIRWRGFGWKTNSTAASQAVDFRAFVAPVQGTANPTGLWKLQNQINNGGYTDRFSVASNGKTSINITAGDTLDGLEISAPFANGTPGTTRHIKLIGTSGGTAFIDFYANSTLKASIGGDTTNGNLNLFSGTGSQISFYNNTPGSPNLLAQIYSGGIYNYAGSFNGGRLTAGSANTSPSSTFTNYGSTGLKITKIDTSGTLTGDYTQILADASGSVCGGTPSNSCGTHTNQGACEQYNSHGGCSWNPGSSCSVFSSESGMGTCAGTSGCTVDSASCAGPSDESSCTSQDDSYGGSCTWNPGSDCGGIGDESTCSGTSGCSSNYSACSWDGMSCSGGTGCDGYYDETACTSALYFSGCSGTYDIGCSGMYNTGGCSGTYGTCSGTPSCAGVGTGSCTSEPGCSLTTGLTLTMPADSADLSRTYWIKKITSGTLTLNANTGQTFYDTGGSTYSTATSGTAIMLSYFRDEISCSALDESTCGSTGGCSQLYSSCSWDSMANTCTGGGSCSGYGDETSCNAGTYYSSCSGTYAASKKWYIMSAYKQQ